MRRGALTAVVLVALWGAAVALAVDKDYDGHVTGAKNDKLSFTVVHKSGKDTKVKNVEIHRIGVDCDGGHQRITPTSGGDADIDSSGKFDFDEANVHLTGEVDGSQASGHLRVKGSFSGSSQNCDSGRVAWTAQH
jgi:hypothetical protein